MKILVVAHPDDEVIWFNPLEFDKIVIVFMNRKDKPEMLQKRAAVILNHPLGHKIACLGLEETGIKFVPDYLLEDGSLTTIKTIKNELKMAIKDATEIYTHNKKGEYGHYEHILVHHAVKDLVEDTDIKMYCPTNKLERPTLTIKNNVEFSEGIVALYKREGAWTWHKDFVPDSKLYFNKITN